MAAKHFSNVNFNQNQNQVQRLVRLQREAEDLILENHREINRLMERMTTNEQQCERRRGEALLPGRKTLNSSSFVRGVYNYLRARQTPATVAEVVQYLRNHHYTTTAATGLAGQAAASLSRLVSLGYARRIERGSYQASA